MQQKTLTSESLLQRCVQRIAQREERIQAWSHLNVNQALVAACQADQAPSRGLLHGIPIGIKDVIDTVDMPTSYGSAIYAQHQPVADAYCVAALKQAGAIILGKTTTSEFAHTQPPLTRNPHNPEHTPGGSSSGSAAAVADGMIPAALATQTGGSIIRPAAYCGVIGFKPTYGAINTTGVKPMAPSLDTVGLMARKIDDIALLMRVLVHHDLHIPKQLSATPRVAFFKTPYWENIQSSSQQHLTHMARHLEVCGAQVTEITLSESFSACYPAQRLIMNYEAARSLYYESITTPHLMSDALTQQLAMGRDNSLADYQNALTRVRAARAELANTLEQYDFILTPAAPGIAPKGIQSSGESIVNRNWTALGVPCITLPTGNAEGMPIGIQLVGKQNQDMALLKWAQWITSNWSKKAYCVQ